MREKDPMPDEQTGCPVRARDSELDALRRRIAELEGRTAELEGASGFNV